MQEEMEKRQQDLAEAQDIIRRLEEQLKLLQAAKEELEMRQNELQVRKLKIHKWVLNDVAGLQIKKNYIFVAHDCSAFKWSN